MSYQALGISDDNRNVHKLICSNYPLYNFTNKARLHLILILQIEMRECDNVMTLIMMTGAATYLESLAQDM